MKKSSNTVVKNSRIKKAALVTGAVIATGSAIGLAIGLSPEGQNSNAENANSARIAQQTTADPTAGKIAIDVSWRSRNVNGAIVVGLDLANPAYSFLSFGLNSVTRQVRRYADQDSLSTPLGTLTPGFIAAGGAWATESYRNRLRSYNETNTALQGVTEDWATFIRPGFSVLDEQTPSKYYFSYDDFLTWLSGGFTTTSTPVSVYDTELEEMVTLPQEYRTPNWSGIRRGDFRVRWTSTNSKYYAANAGVRLTPGFLPFQYSEGEAQLTTRLWIDIAPYIKRLKELAVSGTTKNLIATDFNALVADIRSQFGRDAIRIYAYDKNNKPADVTTLTANTLPTSLTSEREIEFAIYGNSTNNNNLTLIGNMVDGQPNAVFDSNSYTFAWTGTSRAQVKIELALDDSFSPLGYLKGSMNNLTAESFSSLRTAFKNTGEMDQTVTDPNRNLVDIYFALAPSNNDTSTFVKNYSFMPGFVMRDYLNGKLRLQNGALYSTDYSPSDTSINNPYARFGPSAPASQRNTFGFVNGSTTLNPIFAGFMRTDVGRSLLRWKPVIVGENYYRDGLLYQASKYVFADADKMNPNGNALVLPTSGDDPNQIYTYINTQPLLDNFEQDKVRFYGYGNSIQVLFTDPNLIAAMSDNKLGLELQFRTNTQGAGIPVWRRLELSKVAQAVDTTRGYIAAAAGTYSIINFTPEQSGVYKDNFEVSFRIVPTQDEAGNKYDNSTWRAGSGSGVNQVLWSNNVFVTASDTQPGVATSLPDGKQVTRRITDRQNLQVTTRSAYLDSAAYKELTGNTHDIELPEVPAATAEGWLSADNSSRATPTAAQDPNFDGWGKAAVPGYGVSLKSAAGTLPRYYFRAADFKTWLAGEATTSMKVYDTNTYQYINLPSALVLPDWNNIDMAGFSARWLPNSDLYIVTDQTAVSLNTDKLLFWADMTAYMTRLKNLFIEGDTAHMRATDFSNIITSINTTFGANKFQVELSSSFDELTTPEEISARFSATPSFADEMQIARNSLTNRVNGQRFQINSWLQLGFRIVPVAGQTSLLSSVRKTPKVTNVVGNWVPLDVTQYGGSLTNVTNYLKFFADINAEVFETIARSSLLFGSTRELSYSLPYTAPRTPLYDTGPDSLLRNSGLLNLDIWGKFVTKDKASEELNRKVQTLVSIDESTRVNGLNIRWMPPAILKEYLAGNLMMVGSQVYFRSLGTNGPSLAQLSPYLDAQGNVLPEYAYMGLDNNFGFTADNVVPPAFDGTWGQGRIRMRVIADKDYEMSRSYVWTPSASGAVSDLYTAREVTNLTKFLRKASTDYAEDGVTVVTTSSKDVQENGVVKFPSAFVNLYANSGLRLQYTTKGQLNEAQDGVTISSNPEWRDVAFRPISAQSIATNTVPSVDIAYGFTTRMEPIVTGTVNSTFLAFRLVPIRSDTGTNVAGSSDDLNFYTNLTKTRLFVSNGTLPDRVFTNALAFYPIGSSSQREAINVRGLNLSSIQASGSTRNINFAGEQALINQVDALNTDKTLDSLLRLLYTIDLADGSFINGASDSPTALWLTKEDFTAYLKGELMVANGRVVHRNDISRIVEAFTSDIIVSRNLKNGDTVTPDYARINTVTGSFGDPNRRNSIFVKWSTVDEDYVENNQYAPSVITPAALSYTSATLKKWVSGEALNDSVKNLIVTGNTKDWEFDYADAAALQAADLTSARLKLQYSLDKTAGSWSDFKLDFTSATWAQKVERKFWVRVVPLNYSGTGTVSAENLTDEDNLLIDYTTQDAGAEPKTRNLDKVNNDRLFKVHINVTAADLANIELIGNPFALDPRALSETKVDNNIDAFEQVEIQYLFRNRWYNRQDLFAEIARARTAALANGDRAAEYTSPTDFTKLTAQARWRVLDRVNYFIPNQSYEQVPDSDLQQAVSTGQEVDKTKFRTFVNVWDVQDYITNAFRQNLTLNEKNGEAAVIRLTGTTNSLSGKFLLSQIPGFQNFLTNRGLRLQYSTVESPTNTLDSTDWKNVSGSLTGDDFIQDLDLGASRSLWIRFVPTTQNENNVVLSTYSQFGSNLDNFTITPMQLDTSNLSASITTDSAALKDLVVTGNTQASFTADESDFLVPNLISPGVWGLKGITTPSTFSTRQAAIDWADNIEFKISYRVTATRSKGAYVVGQQYIFNSLSALQAALNTTNLNFDRSSLEVRWYAVNTLFQLSDQAWVSPVVTDLKNVVYTEDTFTLTGTTYTLSGNNIKVNSPSLSNDVDPSRGLAASFVLTTEKLAVLGLKLQFNVTNLNNAPDPTKWSDTAISSGLNSSRDYWIRYAPISDTYTLATNLSGKTGDQTIKLRVSTVKVAIPFKDYTTAAQVLAKFRAAALAGKTYDFNWSKTGNVVNDLPEIYASSDNIVHGKIQYSIDSRSYYDTLAEALASSDYYGNGVLGLDKDRGDTFSVRYAFKTTPTSQNPLVSDDYVYTDAEGNELALSDLSRNISIDNLVQPVLSTQSLQKLTGTTPITVPDGNGGTVKTPTGGSDFSNTTWQDLANSNLFTPRFGPSGRPRELAFQYMQYDNKLRNALNQYIFNLGQNPFNKSQVETKTDLNALAPRHSHFEFRTRESENSPWSAWSRTAPNNVTAATAFNSFAVRLVADDKFDLEGWTTPSTFLDGSARTVVTVPSQNWEREFPAAIVVSTSGISLPTVATQQASYIGFDDSTTPAGTLLTNDINGNHNPSNDPANLRDVAVNILDSGNPMNFRINEVMYVLEWNVRNAAGENISWTDSRGVTASGWHYAGLTGVESDIPGANVPWYGAYPTSLKNGDLVQVRLRVREGYEIEGDTLSTDYSTVTQRSRWSKALSFAPVTGLVRKITLPTGFNFYDRAHPTDLYGEPLTVDQTAPFVTFSGNGGSGKLQIENPDTQADYTVEVAVLRPVNGEVQLNGQAPVKGYAVETYLDQQGANGRTTVVYTTPGSGNTGGYVANWQSLVRWVSPSDINDLSVGDALVFRLRAKTGAGFAWESARNNFVDVNFPKDLSGDRFGTPLGSAPAGTLNLNMNTNSGTPPLPVRGLLTRPPVDLSALNLVYSEDPLLRLNGVNNQVTLSTVNGPRDIWRWEYQRTSAAGVTGLWTEFDTRFPSDLRNGESISVRAKAVGGSALDQNYTNVPVKFDVDKLLTVLDASNIGRPLMRFSGYEGLGTIQELYNASGQGNRGPQWSDPEQGYALGRPLLTSEGSTPGQLVWEYQVLSEDPLTAPAERIAQLVWTTTIPANLKYGDYVRVRVGAVAVNTIALADNKVVYGQNLTNPSETGWTRVENLLLNPRKIDYRAVVTGSLGETSLSSAIIRDTLDAKAVTPEFQYESADGTLSPWLTRDANPVLFDETFGKLMNEGKIHMRVKALPGYRMDPNDPDLLATEKITAVEENGVTNYYLQKQAWTRNLDFLQINVLTTEVTLSGLRLLPMDSNPEPERDNNQIRTGFATIAPVTFSNIERITDRDFNRIDYKGNTYSDSVRVRYILRTLNTETNLPNPDLEIAYPNLPIALNNGDIVIAELVSTNPEYKLSDTKRIQLVVTGLTTKPSQGVANPVITFTGVPSLDSASKATGTPTTSIPPERTRWAYYVVRKNEVKTDPTTGSPIFPVDLNEAFWDSVKDPQNNKWYYSTVPNDLDNGDYVVAVLVPNVRGGSLEVENVTGGNVPKTQIPRSPNWVLVSGLSREVNLTGYTFNLYDANNPYNPLTEITDSNKVNFAFKLVGEYQNAAYLDTNSPLYTLDDKTKNRVLVSRDKGEPLPESINQKVQFGFAVSNKSVPDAPLVYSPNLPRNLRNGDWIHVMLLTKPEVTDVRIVGYESQTFQVTGLKDEPSISAKTVTLIASISAGIGTLGIATLAVILIRRRRRKLYFPDKV